MLGAAYLRQIWCSIWRSSSVLAVHLRRGERAIEAIEGKRAGACATSRPSRDAVAVGKPTALNNVETFANVPQILSNGVDWYKARGRTAAAGMKFVGVSGDVRRPASSGNSDGDVASDEFIFRARRAGAPVAHG